jgi:hypothetical protein
VKDTPDKGLFAIPAEMRKKIDALAEEALFDTRNEDTLEINAQQAARRTVNMLMAQAPDMVWRLMENGLNALVAVRVLALIEKSKKAYARQVVYDGEHESFADVVERCYLEIVTYREKGRSTAVKKYLGDMTLSEIRLVNRQYAQKRLHVGRRINRFKAIAEKMEQAGASADTRVSEVFKTGTES